MAWNDPVDIYCERLGPGLLAEPWNALSNLGFIVAGLVLLAYARRRSLPPMLQVLAGLLVLIGLGSTSFHTVANKATEVLDVACIGVFIYTYITCYARYRLELNWWLSLLAIPAFYLFGMALVSPFGANAYNGSVAYFPALAALMLMGLLSAILDGWRSALPWLDAFLIFAVSLWLRSQDLANCESLPSGTHWIWHLLNAATLSLAWWGLRISPRLTAKPAIR